MVLFKMLKGQETYIRYLIGILGNISILTTIYIQRSASHVLIVVWNRPIMNAPSTPTLRRSNMEKIFCAKGGLLCGSRRRLPIIATNFSLWGTRSKYVAGIWGIGVPIHLRWRGKTKISFWESTYLFNEYNYLTNFT